jgi:hypothetical protein
MVTNLFRSFLGASILAATSSTFAFVPTVSSKSLTSQSITQSSVIMSAISNKLALGAGCYWGTEKFVVKDFQQRFPNSIQEASVGFMSPDPNAMENPSYRQVCSGR